VAGRSANPEVELGVARKSTSFAPCRSSGTFRTIVDTNYCTARDDLSVIPCLRVALGTMFGREIVPCASGQNGYR